MNRSQKSKSAKKKGARGEREARDLLQKWSAGHDVEIQRNLGQVRDSGFDLEGLDWLAVEVKRQEQVSLGPWWEQTVKNAEGKIPFLMWKVSRRPWRFKIRVANRYDVEMDEWEAEIWFKDMLELRRQSGYNAIREGACLMPIYYETEQEAIKIRDELCKDVRVLWGRVEFEPMHGWVISLKPKFIDISDLFEIAEIRDGVDRGREHRRRIVDCWPTGRVGAGAGKKASGAASGAGGAATRPRSGATGRVWEIANAWREANPDAPIDRKAIVDKCIEEGINKSTAGVQFGKWKKTQ